MNGPVHLCICESICLSAPHIFSQCYLDCIIMKLSGVIVIDKSVVHAKTQRQIRSPGSKSQRSKQSLAQFGHFWIIILVLIHRWLQNDSQSLKWHRRCFWLLFFFFSILSIKLQVNLGQKWPIFQIFYSFLSPQMAIKWCKKIEVEYKSFGQDK